MIMGVLCGRGKYNAGADGVDEDVFCDGEWYRMNPSVMMM
jgi:hypothetical protein